LIGNRGLKTKRNSNRVSTTQNERTINDACIFLRISKRIEEIAEKKAEGRGRGRDLKRRRGQQCTHDGCGYELVVGDALREEGDSDFDFRIGLCLSAEYIWGRKTDRELQDNAGKTTLLYRLKVCHLQFLEILGKDGEE
jgi:hypothetical protein